MLELLWDLYQQHQLSELRRDAAVNKGDVEVAARQTAMREAQALDARLDRLVLVVHAMWTLLREKTDLTETDLLKRITDLDGQDGSVDGRTAVPPVPCAKCGAMISRKFNRCLFCSEPYVGGNAFDTV
jgi:hypothetical protein